MFSQAFRDSGQSSQAADDSLHTDSDALWRDFTIWLGLSKFGAIRLATKLLIQNWPALVDLNRDFAHNWNVSLRHEYVDWDSISRKQL